MVAISSTVGKEERDGEREIEQWRRQRQDEDDQDGHHAEGEPDVAAPQHGAHRAQSRQVELSGDYSGLSRVRHWG
jgi:hypothetical protein